MVADEDGFSLMILGESYIKINITYSSVKWSDPGKFLKSRFVIFRCQKYVKKGNGNDKKNLPWDFKKCPGSLHFTILP